MKINKHSYNLRSPASSEHRYYLRKTGARVKVATTPTAKTTRVIYGLFDSHNDELLYAGKTGQKLTRRISWYTCMVNRALQGKVVERAKIIDLLATDPDRYYFKILDRATDAQNLNDVEESVIEQRKPRLNSNRGGGGGSSMQTPNAKMLRPAPVHFKSPITAKKNYALKFLNGRVKHTLTPSAKMKNVIYRIRHIPTGKVYIGQTIDFTKRIASHLSRVNGDETKIIKSALHKAISANPAEYDVGVIREMVLGINLDVLESEIIAHARGQKGVFNLRSGGGGSKPSVAKKLRFEKQ